MVKEGYIHTSNKDTRVQAVNRMRQNLEVVGYYNINAHKEHKKKEKEKVTLEDYCKNIPPEYFNQRLTTEMKEDLIILIDFPKKWTSLKKALINQGYEVIDGSTGAQRYSIIKNKLNK